MTRYLLDTDTCIDLIRHQPAALMRKLDQLRPGEAGVSSITAAELEFGVARSAEPTRNRQALAKLFSALVVLPFDVEAAREYGTLRHELETKGAPIGPLDTLIAAHARQRGLIAVTRNLREFKRVTGLRVESWT